jgi:nucleoid-associated protein YgaU
VPSQRTKDRERLAGIGAVVAVVVAAIAFAVAGLTTSSSARTQTAAPRHVTIAAPPATMSATTTTTGAGGMRPTKHPVKIPGGSFVVAGGLVHLTTVVGRGDTLYGLAQWFDLMGGWPALYALNHSVIGRNPNLIYPGEKLTLVIPAADIPKISPMYRADLHAAA